MRFIGLLLSLVLMSSTLTYRAYAAEEPSSMKTPPKALSACPESPNCVLSGAPDEKHRIEPLPFKGSAAESLARLRQVITSQPRTAIKEEGPGYLHAEFTSLILRFVDDFEALADETAGVLQVRSASRVGYSDLGANRKRVEALREAYLKD